MDLFFDDPVGPEGGLEVQLGVVMVEFLPFHDQYETTFLGLHIRSGSDGWRRRGARGHLQRPEEEKRKFKCAGCFRRGQSTRAAIDA